MQRVLSRLEIGELSIEFVAILFVRFAERFGSIYDVAWRVRQEAEQRFSPWARASSDNSTHIVNNPTALQLSMIR
jgi:hypothetical protein